MSKKTFTPKTTASILSNPRFSRGFIVKVTTPDGKVENIECHNRATANFVKRQALQS